MRHYTRSFSLLRLPGRSSPTLSTSVRTYSPRWLLYKSKTEGEKSTNGERSQESGVERVGWRSLSGWVADARQGRGERKGGCTLKEAVVVGRQWERTETRIEKGRRYRRRRVLREEDRGAEEGEEGQGRVRESRTLQGIKSLFVTGTVMKILCF